MGPHNLMNTKQLSQALKAIEKAALTSGKILRDSYDQRFKRKKVLSLQIVQEKFSTQGHSQGLVTDIDLKSESACMHVLHKFSKSADFLTEETRSNNADSSRAEMRFIIDPLDGTTNFVHGFPMFCVSIGLEFRGELIAGGIYHPILNEMYLAGRGMGATLNGNPLSVSKTVNVSSSLLTTGFAYRKSDRLSDEMSSFEKFSMVARAVRRPGSAALDLAYVSRGVFDGFWEQSLGPWDVAAGIVIVQEAGGQVTDFDGNPPKITSKAILASNGKIHGELLAQLGKDQTS